MLLEAIILGVIQGVLEWLPISSEGNLILVMVMLLGIQQSQALAISVYLHAGTLLSVIIYFRRTIVDLLRVLPKYRLGRSNSEENRLISFLLLSTVLTGLVGYPIYRFAETATVTGEYFIALIGIALIATGLLQKSVRRLGRRTVKELNFTDALVVGLAQGFSAFPGVSRSGVTASCLLFRGFGTVHALNLSFLMSIPAILGAQIGLGLTTGVPNIDILDIALGCFSSFVSGLISIHVLMKVAQRIRFWLFCIIIGLIALLPVFSLF